LEATVIPRGLDSLVHARARAEAIGSFSVYNLELARAVCAAAESSGLPVIMQTGSSAFRHAGAGPLRTLVVAAADESDAEVGVHLDHSRGLDEIRLCLESGYTSVMFDGSALPLDENIRQTREVAVIAHTHDAWVEGELTGIAGNEDRSTDAHAILLTDPEAAERFVEETGVDALAVSIGNVHGFTVEPVRLDLERLQAISERVSVPLVLHGASGLDPHQLRDSIRLGVAKVNINSELRAVFLRALARSLQRAVDDDLTNAYRGAIDAARDLVIDKQRLLASAAERSPAS